MENLEIKNLLGFIVPLSLSAGVFIWILTGRYAPPKVGSGLPARPSGPVPFWYRAGGKPEPENSRDNGSSLRLEPIARNIACYVPTEYKINKRWGGVVLGLTILISLILFQNIFTGFLLPKDFWSLILGIIILLVGGIWDDLKNISWKKQLLFQSAAALLAVFVGDTINHIRLPGGMVLFFPPFFSAVLAYFWIILVIEALNWLDGVDGLSGGVSFVTLAVLAVLGLTSIVNQPSTTLLCLIIAGALLGFLFFNFPPAKVFLGSSGVWILGFLIAVISIYSGGKIATTALVLGIPIIDFIFVSFERIIAGKSPVIGGDRLHLHEQLIDRGWKPANVTILISSFSLLLGLSALLSQTQGKYFLFISLAGFFLFFALIHKSQPSVAANDIRRGKAKKRLERK